MVQCSTTAYGYWFYVNLHFFFLVCTAFLDLIGLMFNALAAQQILLGILLLL